jgi:hypothetical protein
MKRLLLFAILCTPAGLPARETEKIPADTTFVVNNKRIEVKESRDRMKVRVYELTGEGGITEDKMIFEGHYRDGKSYENRRRPNSINIPIPAWNKEFEPHWAGFGIGFANVADNELHMNDVDGVTLRSSSSLEYNLNLPEKSFPFSARSNWAVVIGVGLRWVRYRVDDNKYFMEVDGITSLHPAPDGVNFSSSKLNITYLTIPLLLEWQARRKGNDNFFLSAGIVGGIKTASSSRVAYKDPAGKKNKEKMDGDMNLRPLTMDFLIQAGYDLIGVYAKYSPVGLFEGGKGPKLHPVSIGLQLHF